MKCWPTPAALPGLLLLLASAGAPALERGFTADGRAYVSGGIGQEEASALQAERTSHSLWVTTAARRSGAFLADVRLTIVDARQRVVFDGVLDGPWLLVDLAPGRYSIRARRADEQHDAVTTIHAGDHRALVFYFDVAAEVLSPASRAPQDVPPDA